MAKEFFLHYLNEEADGKLVPGEKDTVDLVLLQPRAVSCPDYSYFSITPSDESLTINLRASGDHNGRIIVPHTNFRSLKNIIAQSHRRDNLDTPLMLQPDSDPLIYFRGMKNKAGERTVILVSNFQPPSILRFRPAR